MAWTIQDLHGMLFPLPTPFTSEGALHEQALAEMTAFYLDKGMHGLFLFGSFGQGPAMAPEERKRALEIVVGAAGDRVPLVAHVGTVDPYTSRDLARHAEGLGVTAIATVGPYYYTDRSDEELVLHLQLIEKSIQTPLFFYNNPAYQGYPLSPERLKAISEQLSGLAGVKIAKGTIDEARRYRQVFGTQARLFAPAGNLLAGMSERAINGSISPPIALIPELGVAETQAIEAGDTGEATRLQKALDSYLAVVHSLNDYGRTAQGLGLRHLGFDITYPRWPTRPLPEDKAAALYEAIDTARAAATTPAGTTIS